MSGISYAKQILRKNIKDSLKRLSQDSKDLQSKEISSKILSSKTFKNAKIISVYLSTNDEVDTIGILQKMFEQNKQVFVPTYHNEIMEMVKLENMDDYYGLPLTKWNIKQPNIEENRENALKTGGIDLFLMPGVAFSNDGKRLGHGRGYYDKYLRRHFQNFPQKFNSEKLLSLNDKITSGKTILLGLAFKEQIINSNDLPVEEHDYQLDQIITSSS